MSQNLTLYERQARTHQRRVWFTGTGALDQGQGVCYSRAVGTATDADGRRDKHVALPGTANNLHFAGVTVRAYSADAKGQWIEIYEPGSVCPVAVGADTVVNSTMLTCSVNAGEQGRFGFEGLPGRGTALALQTTSGILERNDVGTAALDAAGTTLTDSAATFVTNGVAAGDKVVIYGGENDGTNTTTPGIYTVASVTSETVLVLTTAASDGGTMQVSYYVYDDAAPPTALCKLLDGEESGLVEVLSPKNAAASQSMVGGTTYMAGGVTLTADTTATLADALKAGQKKAYKLLAALAGAGFGYHVVVTSGLQMGGTVLSSLEFAAAADTALLQWGLSEWRAITVHGATEA